jgi:2-keto-3-deoxy-L-rhamnonate aldolase RhmA
MPTTQEPHPENESEMVTLFKSSNHNAESEALTIRSLLDANGIESVLVGTAQIPSLDFRVKVKSDDLERARSVIAEAEAAGPKAAAEAEEQSEKSG